MHSPFKPKSQTVVSLLTLLLAASPTLRAEDSPEPTPVVSVSVGEIVRATLHRKTTAYGTVEAAPASGPAHSAGAATLSAAVSGIIVATPTPEGASVEKGELIVQLDSQAAQAQRDSAQSARANAQKALERQQQLQSAGGSSQRALLDAQQTLATAQANAAEARMQLERLAIRAPIAGTLTRLDAQVGSWLDVGAPVATIVDFNKLVLSVQIPSAEAALIRPGQEALVYSRLGETAPPLARATVVFVSKEIQANTDSVRARLALPQDSTLQPGQFLVARILVDTHTDCLAVPEESVFTDEDGQSTLSLVDGNTAHRAATQIGYRENGLIEVSGDGLALGGRVVTEGAYALPDDVEISIHPTSKVAQ